MRLKGESTLEISPEQMLEIVNFWLSRVVYGPGIENKATEVRWMRSGRYVISRS